MLTLPRPSHSLTRRSPRRTAGVLRPVALAWVLSLLLAACSSTTSATSSTSTTSAASAVAVKPPTAIASTGILRIGSGLAYPPMEYFNAQHQPAGVDVALGNAIAKEMGLHSQWVQISFAGLIPALQASRVDIVMADMFITPARAKVVSFVPYFSDGSSIVTAYHNPLHISSLAGLSGKTVAVQLGTTLQATAQAENATLAHEGKPPMTILTFPQATDAMDQLGTGRVQAVLITTSVARWYAARKTDTFSVVGKTLASQPVGIAVSKANPALRTAVAKAVALLKKNGTYARIVHQYLG